MTCNGHMTSAWAIIHEFDAHARHSKCMWCLTYSDNNDSILGLDLCTHLLTHRSLSSGLVPLYSRTTCLCSSHLWRCFVLTWKCLILTTRSVMFRYRPRCCPGIHVQTLVLMYRPLHRYLVFAYRSVVLTYKSLVLTYIFLVLTYISMLLTYRSLVLTYNPWYSRTNPWYSRTNPWYSRIHPWYSRTHPWYSRTTHGTHVHIPGTHKSLVLTYRSCTENKSQDLWATAVVMDNINHVLIMWSLAKVSTVHMTRDKTLSAADHT